MKQKGDCCSQCKNWQYTKNQGSVCAKNSVIADKKFNGKKTVNKFQNSIWLSSDWCIHFDRGRNCQDAYERSVELFGVVGKRGRIRKYGHEGTYDGEE